VVVQETGWTKHLPSGHGALSFTDLAEATEAIVRVTKEYSHHAQAARQLAEEHFEAERVCQQLLQAI
jgi:RNase P/RNase MRP subunit POP5